jgi:predicted CoA-binding protein
LIDRFCDSSDPKQALTLLAYRSLRATPQVIGTASYFALTDVVAEAAFTVADPFHGKGIGTDLLERLAAIASTHTFRWFQATTLADNHAMLEVFRDSGFEIRSKSSEGCVDVQLSLAPSDESVAAAERRDRQATVASLRPVLAARSVAIIGASRTPTHLSRRILDAIVTGGFGGPIHPINPFTTEMGGLRCYRSARDIPTGVDLAIIAVPPQRVLAVVEECGAAGVKALVVITAGFADEMFDIAACLDAQPLPAARRVAIITNAGGPGILAVDACEAAHLVVSDFSEATRARLADCLPPAASLGNPIDMVASAGATEYRRAVEVALTADEVDAAYRLRPGAHPTAAHDHSNPGRGSRNGYRAGPGSWCRAA